MSIFLQNAASKSYGKGKGRGKTSKQQQSLTLTQMVETSAHSSEEDSHSQVPEHGIHVICNSRT